MSIITDMITWKHGMKSSNFQLGAQYMKMIFFINGCRLLHHKIYDCKSNSNLGGFKVETQAHFAMLLP